MRSWKARRARVIKRARKPKRAWLGYALLLLLAGLALWQHSGQNLSPTQGEVLAKTFFLPEEEPAATAALEASLGHAERTVDLALMTLNDTRLGYLLAQTARRGVRVRLFSEREQRDDTLTTLLAGFSGQTSGRPRVSAAQARAHTLRLSEHCEQLEKVEICYDDRPGLMHDKFAVVDDREVWTGSANWSYRGLHNNDNDLLRLEGEAVAGLYHQAFNALWGREPHPPEPATFDLAGGGTLSVYFSSGYGNEALAKLVATIESARNEVWLAAFVLTHPQVVDALNEAAQRGVRVRVLLERRNLPDSAEETLIPQVEVRADANPAAMHLKTLIVDDSAAVTGSFNFTRSAVTRNDENLLVLTQPELARRYKEKVWRAWRRAGP